MVEQQRPACIACKFYRRDAGYGYRCDAFPDGIPADIVEARDAHLTPRRGDRGIQYEWDGERPEAPIVLESRRA